MNDNQNFVSIWCGKFSNEDEFLQYIEMDYENDENSQFMQDFLIDWYDEDLSEYGFYNKNLLENLMQHSYATNFSLEIKKDIQPYLNCNAVFLIYDFIANTSILNQKSKLQLMGVYPYHKNPFESAFNMPN